MVRHADGLLARWMDTECSWLDMWMAAWLDGWIQKVAG